MSIPLTMTPQSIRPICAVIAVLAFSLLCPAAGAIELGITVVNEHRESLPGATVKLRELTTGLSKSAITDRRGKAALRAAQPGVYEITATLANFLSAGVPPFVVGRTDDKEKLDILLTINLESYPNVISVNEAIPPQTLSPYVLSEGELTYIRELVIRKALQTHRNFPSQLDDPIGREYCLTLDSVAGSRPIPAPASLVERFSDDRDVHDPSWCAAHAGRIISVGPLMLATENLVLIWSSSRVTTRAGGADCLQPLIRQEGQWVLGADCVAGAVFN
jgi:hypothetical protein